MTRSDGLRASPGRDFEVLYRRHAADVYRYALVMLDSAADAEDVTQTTPLRTAWLNLPIAIIIFG